MSNPRDELLQPSLTGSVLAQAPYSVQATFLTAFFGGPFAAMAITAINSVRLQRWTRDAIWLGASLVAYLGFTVGLLATDWGASLRATLSTLAGERALRYLFQLVALALFGLGYALHRCEQRSARFMGLQRPRGWTAGLACVVAGIALQYLLVKLLLAGEGA